MDKRLIRAKRHSFVGLAKAADASTWTPPTSLEWMPAGSHEVYCLHDFMPWCGVVTCVEDDAARLDEMLQAALARAAAGEGSRPFIDFDHMGGEAAAIPVRFFWEDGIRLEVEWTAAGEAALRGRNYSYFSPEFYMGDDGRPVGIPEIGPIGGLVNTPAFQRIERLSAARAASTQQNNKEIHMDQTKNTLVEVKLAPSPNLTDAEMADHVRRAMAARVQAEEAKEDELEALKAENARLKDQIARLEAEKKSVEEEVAEAKKAEAARVVDEAVKARKIKDDETTKARWIARFVANREEAQALLDDIPAPSAEEPKRSAAGHPRDQLPSLPKPGDGKDGLTGIDRVEAAIMAKGIVPRRN